MSFDDLCRSVHAMASFTLPPLLESSPVYDHKDENEQSVKADLGRVTTPQETPIFICTMDKCYRLFPSRDRLGQHRKQVHSMTDDQMDVLTWNDQPASSS